MLEQSIRTLCGTVFLSALLYPVVAAADECPEHVTVEAWADAVDTDQQVRDRFLSMLERCLPGNSAMQEEIDYLAVMSFEALDALPAEHQPALADLAVRTLRANAQAGFASSQHNYAAAHKARPGSQVAQMVPQDHATFVHWTRKAASQKEPRSLFNLAVRLAAEPPPPGIVQDLATAYVILTFLEETHDLGIPPAFVEHVRKLRQDVSKQLGPARVKALTESSEAFDFSSLASA